MAESETNELKIFNEAVETGEPDPRQAQFRVAMDAIDAENATPVHRIGMQGFRASHIDIGWISEQVLDYVILEPVTAAELAALLVEELPQIVQRLKRVAINTDDWPDSIEIELETKDDNGWYHYRFSAPVD